MGISNALKAATKATEDVLQRFLPAWLPGRTEIAAAAGYVEYGGSPVGNLTPDFVGQTCQDTTTGIFYKAVGLTANSWSAATKKYDGYRVALLGDSLTQYNNQFLTPTSISRTSNVATVSYTSHGIGDQNVIRVCGVSGFNTESATATRIDVNTFSYPSVGSDGSATIDTTYARVACLGWFSTVSFFMFANSALNLALRMVNNYGNSSETTAMMVTRIAAVCADAVSRGCDEVWVMAGSNDVAGSTTAATTKTNLSTIYQTILAAGLRVRALTIPPLGSAHASIATATPKIIQVNEWIRQYASGRTGIQVADVFSGLVSPTQTDGRAVTNALQSDNIHFQTYGAYLAGQKIAASYNGQLPTPDRLTKSAADTYAVDASNPNIWVNAPMTNTGGTISDVVSGTAADGFNIASSGNAGRTAVASVVSRSDGFGYDQQVVFTPAAGNDTLTIQEETSATLAARVTAGEKYRVRCSVSMSGVVAANLSYFRGRIQGTFGGTLMTLGSFSHPSVFGSGNVSTDMTLVIESPEFVIPPGACTTLSVAWIWVCTAAGTALTVKVGRVSVDRVDTSA